ncbi:MAG: carboxymuconolactone decarboxylase family protein [Desulfarculaceae bacterium]|nr:carboxymuconolactone decarboxylase family protein [Desulfarculaceae bacterium]MCF8048022.1 carboxymuconolactone decarboxylase family protein [Desulfarculaceae bacterium]MCF8066282.1 carboxymuconolactone decarboxylase family protein [Desulfarculaceae bacterium]MCF8097828.1 carboxymuconolactone decarboxylase family protein [Desulfarculaceae bacterium]MCF8123633.1 carboxymuconolactone decarboxylase family protein [Desulfarculaceae bacterium]
MSESLLTHVENQRETFELSKQLMLELAEAYYTGVKDAVYGSEGALDLKTRRLMSLAVAVQAGCKNCILAQTNHALEQGASIQEIVETCQVAISMGGTMAWSHTLMVVDFLQERGLV